MNGPSAPQSPQPLVTVAVVTFNRRDRLIASMQRLREQTYANIEWIVVDGGSTDGTAQWLVEHAEAWGFRFCSESDRGEYDALNKATRMATGKYIKYFSDDDLLHTDAIARYVEFCEAHPEFGLVFARARLWQLLPGDTRADLGVSPLFEQADFTARRILRHDTPVNSMTAFMHLDLMKRVGPFRIDWVGGDYEYWVRACLAGERVGQLDHVTVEYQFTNENNVTRRAFRIGVEAVKLAQLYGTAQDVAHCAWQQRRALLGLTQARTELARQLHKRGLRPGKWLRERADRISQFIGR